MTAEVCAKQCGVVGPEFHEATTKVPNANEISQSGTRLVASAAKEFSWQAILCDIQCVSHTMPHTVDTPMNASVLENLRLELRRGCLILAVLAELRSERYGYTLRKALAD